jgi:hypothetical protein
VRIIESKVFSDQISYQPEFLNEIHEFCEILVRIRSNFTVSHAAADTSFNEDEPPTKEATVIEASSSSSSFTDSMLAKRRLGPSSSLNRRSSIRTLKPIQENSPPKLQRRNTLCASHNQVVKSQSVKVIEQAKMDMFEWLSTQFASYFDSDFSSHLPYSGFFCYDKLEVVKKRLFDVQRINVHECLLNSYGYLKASGYLSEAPAGFSPKNRKNLRRSPNSGRVLDTDGQSERLLPLNVVYKLYLECGHMINLYDWLQAFVEKEENEDLRELSEAKRKSYQ